MNKWKKLNEERNNLFREINILKIERLNDNISFERRIEIGKIIEIKKFKYNLINSFLKTYARKK
ncbi:MAG: hypothetical protein IJB82_02325 [Bacilli bacterium]|nr:hypothetical protein [Bacilli bacterium]